MGEDEFGGDSKKAHIKRKAGKKADKKNKEKHVQEGQTAKQKNPKAFAIQNVKKVNLNIFKKWSYNVICDRLREV